MYPPDVPSRPGSVPSPPPWSSRSRSSSRPRRSPTVASPAVDPGFPLPGVVDRLPEFVPRCLALVEAGDDDPGEPAVLMELAGFVTERLGALSREESALSRALGLVEDLLGDRAGDDAGVVLIGDAFFDSFTVEDRRMLGPRLGPRSLELLESLELPRGDDPRW